MKNLIDDLVSLAKIIGMFYLLVIMAILEGGDRPPKWFDKL